jgi:integrase
LACGYPNRRLTPAAAQPYPRRSEFLKEWRITVHGLRHTHASHLLALKEHSKVVQEGLARSSIAITMDIYSHLMPNMQEDAAAAVDGALRAAIKKRNDDIG